MVEIGLAPPLRPTPGTTATSDRDQKAPAEFIAGWYYGSWAQEDKRDYIIGCYKPNEDLTNTLYDAMEAYIKGDESKAEDLMKKTRPMYEAALQKCDEVSSGIKKFDDEMFALT